MGIALFISVGVLLLIKKTTGSYSYVCATVVIGFMVLHFLWSFMMEIFIFIITLYGDGGCILI